MRIPTPLATVSSLLLGVGVLAPAVTAGAAGSAYTHPRTAASALKVGPVGFTFTPPGPDDTYGDLSAAAVVSNPTSKVAAGIRITITLKNARGRTIDSRDDSIEYLGPGDEAYAVWQAGYPEEAVPAKVTARVIEVDELVAPGAFADDLQYSIESDRAYEIDELAVEFDDVRYHDAGIASSVVGTARVPSGIELADVDARCAAFADGEVIGGGWAKIPVIPEGETVGFQTTTGFIGGLEPDEVRCAGQLFGLAARAGTRVDGVVVADAGFGLDDDYTVSAVVENPTDLWAWYTRAAIDFLDASGRVVGSVWSDESVAIAPGGVWYATATVVPGPDELDGTVASVTARASAGDFLTAREMRRESLDPSRYEFEFADLAIAGKGVTGTITHHGPKKLNAVGIWCALYRDGTIVGGAQMTLDDSDLDAAIPADTPTPFDLFTADVGADEARCSADLVPLSLG